MTSGTHLPRGLSHLWPVLQVLCTTSTLAMGVNLPARLVVLKGTRRYVGSEAEDASGYQEYERSTCLQARRTNDKRRVGLREYCTALLCVEVLRLARIASYQRCVSTHALLYAINNPELHSPCQLRFADGWARGPAPV